MAYERVEPLPAAKAEIQAAMLASVAANAAGAVIKAMGGRMVRTFEVKDFLPEYWAEEPAGQVAVDELTMEEQVAFVETLAKVFKAKDLRK